jgi:ATP-dependent protease Clp ATPase subunit
MSQLQATRRCSFCNRDRDENNLFRGQDVCICGSCIGTASKIFDHTARVREHHRQSSALHCSFCRKSERELNMLCAGPNVYICDACTRDAAGSVTRSRSAVEGLVRALLRRVRSWRRPGSHYQRLEAL